ncbi:MAG: hypothetical protein U0X91_21575 [Spirosomataceae bacterium]
MNFSIFAKENLKSKMHSTHKKELLIINGVEIPLMQKGRLNIYNEQQIKAAGGVDALSNAINYKKPQNWPTMDFTEEEWNHLERLLKED